MAEGFRFIYLASDFKTVKLRLKVDLVSGGVDKYGLCKKLEFDHKNKWYTHNPESVQNNEMHKILWDFEI